MTTHLCPRNFWSSCPVSTLHIRTLQSPPPVSNGLPLQEATSEPSAEMLTPLTRELWPSSFLSSLPVPTSHSRIVLLSPPDPLTSRVGFDGLKLTQYTPPLWPSSVVRHVPNSTSQILSVASQDADTMVLPWGEKTHAVTKSLPFFELSGNTYVVVVYASPPLNLRLSPGERGRPKKKKLG